MNERKAFFGVAAMAAAQAVKYVLQFAVLPLLARKLGPDAYGVVGVAMPFILFANLISDMGLGNALVRVQNPSRTLESTVFWLSELICALLALGVCVLSIPASRVFAAPGLTPVLLALSPILIIGGSLSVANARITRERRFTLFAVSDAFASTVSSLAAIAAAMLGWGAWSLVAQQLILWGVKAICLHAVVRFRPHMVLEFSAARPFLGFGINSAASNVADFVAKGSPTLIVGALMGVSAVGHYAMAFQVIRIPNALIAGPIYMAVFAAIARHGGQNADVTVRTTSAIRAIAAGTAPMFFGLAAVSDLAVHLFLGAKWAATSRALMFLAPAGFLFGLYSIFSATLMGLGRSWAMFRLTLLSGVLMNLGVAIGSRFGLAAVAGGLSLGVALAAPAYFRAVASALGASATALALEIAPPLAASAAMLAAVWGVRPHLTSMPEIGQLTVSALVGALAYGAVIAVLCGRKLASDIRDVLPGRAMRADLV